MKNQQDERTARIKRMSKAFRRLRRVTDVLGRKAGELEALADDVALLREYMASGQWLGDFEADEKGEIGADVDRSVLSEDGLYNLLDDLDELLRSFDRLSEVLGQK